MGELSYEVNGVRSVVAVSFSLSVFLLSSFSVCTGSSSLTLSHGVCLLTLGFCQVTECISIPSLSVFFFVFCRRNQAARRPSSTASCCTDELPCTRMYQQTRHRHSFACHRTLRAVRRGCPPFQVLRPIVVCSAGTHVGGDSPVRRPGAGCMAECTSNPNW